MCARSVVGPKARGVTRPKTGWTVLHGETGDAGKCVKITEDEYSWFCDEHVYKGSLYVPANFTLEDIVKADSLIGETMIASELSHCWTWRRHVACGFRFAPCATVRPPTPSGLCKSACEKLSDCDDEGGNNGDFIEACDMSFVVDDIKDKKRVCGDARVQRASRALLVLVLVLTFVFFAA